METITLNVDEAVAEQFRKTAAERYGKKKGHLAKAATEALNEWVHSEADAVAQALAAIKKGINAPQLH